VTVDIERGVEAAWRELERQASTRPWVWVSREDTQIDGYVNMPLIVLEILKAMEKTDENPSKAQ
jgi:hypothetical protein